MVYGFNDSKSKVEVVDKATYDSKITELESKGSITIDTALSDTSTNPVQNKAVKAALDAKQDTMSAGTGIALDGATINHSNSITPSTGYVGSATKVPMIKYDAQGHITGTSTATIYPPTTAGSSGQVWVSDGTGAGAWKTLVTVSTSEPTDSDGQDGDIWFVYE